MNVWSWIKAGFCNLVALFWMYWFLKDYQLRYHCVCLSLYLNSLCIFLPYGRFCPYKFQLHNSYTGPAHTYIVLRCIMKCVDKKFFILKSQTLKFEVEMWVFRFWMKKGTIKHQPHCVLSVAPVPFVVLPFVASTSKIKKRSHCKIGMDR